MCQRLKPCHAKQAEHRFWWFTKPVYELLEHLVLFFLCLYACNTLVYIQLLEFVCNITCRNISIGNNIHGRIKFVTDILDALSLFYSLAQHLAVQIIAHCLHMAALLRAEQIARTADFKVSHGNLKAAAKV